MRIQTQSSADKITTSLSHAHQVKNKQTFSIYLAVTKLEYYDQYGGSTGSATTRSNYGGGTTTNYYDQYGGSIGSSTTRQNYGGGTTTTYYDAYGNNLGSSYGW